MGLAYAIYFSTRQEMETLAELSLDELSEEDWAKLQKQMREALGWAS